MGAWDEVVGGLVVQANSKGGRLALFCLRNSVTGCCFLGTGGYSV